MAWECKGHKQLTGYNHPPGIELAGDWELDYTTEEEAK